MAKKAKICVGIDYGSSKVSVGLYPLTSDGGPTLLSIRDTGHNPPTSMPTAVRLKKAENGSDFVVEVYGQFALSEAANNEQGNAATVTISYAKLDIGKGEFVGKRKLPDRFNSITPEDVAALILSYLKKQVEQEKDVQLQSTTISVPANWNPIQRQATKYAALLAGFTDVALIDEPVAALTHLHRTGQFQTVDAEKKIMVIDFGGGTCDIAVIRPITQKKFYGLGSEETTLKIHRVIGINALGGNLINQLLLEKYLEYEQNTHDQKPSLAKQKDLLGRLEDLKKRVNKNVLYPVSQANINGGLNGFLDKLPEDAPEPLGLGEWAIQPRDFHNWLNEETRPELKLEDDSEGTGRSIIQAFRDLVQEAVAFSGGASEIGQVYLVGGSSQLYFVNPIVMEVLPSLESGKTLIQPANPEQCVALGAAWYEYERLKRFFRKESFTPRFFYSLALDSKDSTPIPIKDIGAEGEPLGKKGFVAYSEPFTVSEATSELKLKVLRIGSQQARKDANFIKTLSSNQGTTIQPNQWLRAVVEVERDGIIHIKVEDTENNTLLIENDPFPTKNPAFDRLKKSVKQRLADLPDE